MTPEELEARLRAEAEAPIKAMVGQYRQSANKSMDEMERAALSLGKQMRETALREMVECPECGGRLQAKGQQPKWVQKQAGEVQVRRTYYYCETCGSGSRAVAGSPPRKT